MEVKQQAVLCALFFNLNNRDRSGTVKLAIKSNSRTQELTVNSQNNTYNLNEHYLSSLKQWSQNFIELAPGNYRVKIREGNASYWSDEKKFKLEPWALIWIKAGKFVTQLTGVVNLKISDRSTQIKNQVVEQLQGDIDQRISTVVNLKVDNQAEEITRLL